MLLAGVVYLLCRNLGFSWWSIDDDLNFCSRVFLDSNVFDLIGCPISCIFVSWE